MWVITRIGFFNIIEQDDDREKGLLTVKARSEEDLEKFMARFQYPNSTVCGIEQSPVTDYRYRLKAPRVDVCMVMDSLVGEIDYGKTKPAIMRDFPERSGIYYQVWEDLYEIQRIETAPTKNPR